MAKNEYLLTSHVKEQMQVRGITEDQLNDVLHNPEQTLDVGHGKTIW